VVSGPAPQWWFLGGWEGNGGDRLPQLELFSTVINGRYS